MYEVMVSKLRIFIFLILSLLHFGDLHSSGVVAVLGDSNTWLGGDKCDSDKGWTYWFKMVYQPDICRSFARSGATWTHAKSTRVNLDEYTEVITDDNVVSNQLERMNKAVADGSFPVPELIIIAAGTNDAWFGNRRPDALTNNASPTSIRGAVADVCASISRKYPDTKVLLITPMRSPRIPDKSIKAVSEQILEVSGMQKNVIGVMRMDTEDYIDIKKETVRPSYFKDGVHTSVAGARRNGTLVAEFIKTSCHQ